MTFWQLLGSIQFQNILLVASGLVLLWYTIETYRLRKEAQRTNRLTIRPIVMCAFNIPAKNLFITSFGSGHTLNYKVYAENQQTRERKDLESGFVMTVGNRYEVAIDFWDQRDNFRYYVEYEDLLKNRYISEWQPHDKRGLVVRSL